MDSQEIYNRVATHLLRQGKKSIRFENLYNETVCVYRGDGGTSCAVGCLISDELYSKNMEGKSVDILIRQHPDLLPKDIDIVLLRSLQTLHDSYPVECWKVILEIRGKAHGLDTSILETL